MDFLSFKIKFKKKKFIFKTMAPGKCVVFSIYSKSQINNKIFLGY